MSDFETVFATLRQAMLEAAPQAIIATDGPGDLVLHTQDVDAKTGKPIWFGAVAIKKSYVAYHLFPLYTDPALGAGISDDLTRRRQGKSCFNFKTVEPDLLAELTALTRAAASVMDR